MAKGLKIILSAALFFGLSYGSASIVEGAAKKYGNCTELNKDYKGGVAKDSKVKNKGGKTKYNPFVSKALYEANVSKDRDKDGIACER
ncbi:excalibur calcium-binding domain-containing protein [Bacillus sp. FJAT-27445]|uniref:excalibur calcium-binding domain-containing protein n=1 Tax=Bacillus sp. FJAT-27445 TaxID=1679166 RepID=UPI00074383BA|nr:excalibur calcium-binding domain-containing protein [Bacillus sp. FJAT-27445]